MTAKPKQLQCNRCRAYVHHETIETLQFKSKHKTTDLLLCPKCFETARDTFIKWMDNK